MIYHLRIEEIYSYEFNDLLAGLTFKDNNPFGYVVMVREYGAEFAQINPEYHEHLMRDKLKYRLKANEAYENEQTQKGLLDIFGPLKEK